MSARCAVPRVTEPKSRLRRLTGVAAPGNVETHESKKMNIKITKTKPENEGECRILQDVELDSVEGGYFALDLDGVTCGCIRALNLENTLISS